MFQSNFEHQNCDEKYDLIKKTCHHMQVMSWKLARNPWSSLNLCKNRDSGYRILYSDIFFVLALTGAGVCCRLSAAKCIFIFEKNCKKMHFSHIISFFLFSHIISFSLPSASASNRYKNYFCAISIAHFNHAETKRSQNRWDFGIFS